MRVFLVIVAGVLTLEAALGTVHDFNSFMLTTNEKVIIYVYIFNV